MRLVPHRITRYVFTELMPPFTLGLGLYTFVLMMNHFFIVAEKALSKSLGMDLTVQLFMVGIPRILLLSIPMSVLLGVLIAVGRMSADHEWVALQSAGQSPTRLLWPVMLFGVLTMAGTMVLYGYVVPKSNFAMRNLRGEILLTSNLAADLKPRIFYTDLPETVIYVSDIVSGVEERRLRGVLLVTEIRDGLTELQLAREGDLYPAADGSGNLIFDLYDGISHNWKDKAPEDYKVASFDHRREVIPMASYLQAFLSPPQRVVADFGPVEIVEEVLEAHGELRKLEALEGANTVVAGIRLRMALVEFHQRLALPAACFLFAILALPLGITRVRSGKGAGFAMSLVVILIYWAVYTFGRNQAVSGNLPVWLGVWLANFVIVPWALIALARLYGQERDRRGLVALALSPFVAVVRRVTLWARRRQRARQPGTANGVDDDPVVQLADLGGTSTRFVRRLDTYVAGTFVRTLFFTLMSTYAIYSLVELKTLMDGVLRNDQPVSLVWDYFKYFPPGVLPMVLPISCLVGGVVTFSLLSRTGELTAMKASGISMRRVTLPVIAITAMLSAVVFFVEDRVAPTTNRRAQEVKDQISGRTPRSYASGAVEGRYSIDPGWTKLYHYRFYEPAEEVFRELTVLTVKPQDGENGPRVLDQRYAEQGRWNGETWELTNGWYRSFPRDDDDSMTFRHFETDDVALAAPETFTSKVFRFRKLDDLAEQMSVTELKNEIASLDARGYDITRLKVDYHTRWAHPWSPLVMLLLGLPFAFKVGRRGSMYSVGVALLLVLVYWAALAIFSALGFETVLDPIVAAWTPNVLFALVGFYLMLFIRT